MPVVITTHARERFYERGGKWRLSPTKIRRRILGALAVGVEVVNDAVEVPVGSGFWAVCVPMISGGWSVVTVFRDGEGTREGEVCGATCLGELAQNVKEQANQPGQW